MTNKIIVKSEIMRRVVRYIGLVECTIPCQTGRSVAVNLRKTLFANLRE